ncbi:hypothetical protein IM792_07385 [Mucilaginibacter sp. JRF]|uniref:hypothetical protein n=1 Tax=Mucilaginibacter sp. JRF TaxID=2780088 RepID=UPI001882140F|nr:hypothetical protein [Mucilaginibacter sp. JRF]MBE9584264.1 hypothetical protein [Mucilaginibacter sp. JRF]
MPVGDVVGLVVGDVGLVVGGVVVGVIGLVVGVDGVVVGDVGLVVGLVLVGGTVGLVGFVVGGIVFGAVVGFAGFTGFEVGLVEPGVVVFGTTFLRVLFLLAGTVSCCARSTWLNAIGVWLILLF